MVIVADNESSRLCFKYFTNLYMFIFRHLFVITVFLSTCALFELMSEKKGEQIRKICHICFLELYEKELHVHKVIVTSSNPFY